MLCSTDRYIYPDYDQIESSEIYRNNTLEGETYQQFVKRMRREASGVENVEISVSDKLKNLYGIQANLNGLKRRESRES